MCFALAVNTTTTSPASSAVAATRSSVIVAGPTQVTPNGGTVLVLLVAGTHPDGTEPFGGGRIGLQQLRSGSSAWTNTRTVDYLSTAMSADDAQRMSYRPGATIPVTFRPVAPSLVIPVYIPPAPAGTRWRLWATPNLISNELMVKTGARTLAYAKPSAAGRACADQPTEQSAPALQVWNGLAWTSATAQRCSYLKAGLYRSVRTSGSVRQYFVQPTNNLTA